MLFEGRGKDEEETNFLDKYRHEAQKKSKVLFEILRLFEEKLPRVRNIYKHNYKHG